MLDAALLRHSVYGDISILKKLLEMGANPNTKDKEGMTPLHRAVEWLHNEKDASLAVLLLIQYGAVPTVSDFNGRTPLHIGAEKGIGVKTLLENGAKVNAQDHHGRTALHEATTYQSNEIESLLKAGADPNIQDDNGNTSLHEAVKYEYIDQVKLLLENGANRHLRNNEGLLPGGMGIYGKYISKKTMDEIQNLISKI